MYHRRKVTKKPFVRHKTAFITPSGNWPYRIATEIDAMQNRESKVEALNAVDEPFREWVRFYLNDWQRKRKNK
jgi:hypothetical protein